VGIVKAYTTRVGAGPFVTELKDDIGDYIQRQGAEFGATTGRRRRCGWLDLVMVRDSVRLNGLTSLSITKLDVLSGLDTLRLCVGYELQGERIDARPASLKVLARCQPIYEEMPGWQEDISAARAFDHLPPQAQVYLRRIEAFCEIPLSIISVGAMRDQTIVMKNPFSVTRASHDDL
jgi:adenylosuccinate synthase